LETIPQLSARSWNQTHSLYLDLVTDTSLTEPSLIQYRDSLNNSSMAPFATIDAFLSLEDWNQVYIISQNINCASVSEHNYIEMLKWIALKRLSLVDTLSTSEEMFLDSLSSQNSIQKGKGIIAARVQNTSGLKRFRWYNDGNISTSAAKMANAVDEQANDLELSNIAIYPNPTKNTFEVSGLQIGENIYITDMQGKTVWSGAWDGKPIHTNLQPGLYVVKVRNTISKLVISL
jgi:hypothetical protein